MKEKYSVTFLRGLIYENPVFVMLLGMCPAFAVTTQAANGIGMGLASTFVLVCSNLIISLLKKVIPGQVRLPAYIVVITGFVTFVTLILQAYVPALYDSLGLYLSLIAVNCIILGRAEVFASKNKPLASVADGLGMGLGFTFALTVVGAAREVIGTGSIFGMRLYDTAQLPSMSLLIMPAGGFFTLAMFIALMNYIKGKNARDIGCDCGGDGGCSGCGTDGKVGTEVGDNVKVAESVEVK